MSFSERVPVIVGVGVLTQRTEDPSAALDPLELMAEASRRAALDTGVDVENVSAIAIYYYNGAFGSHGRIE